MSTTLKGLLTIALAATCVGTSLLPTETIARDAYHHYGTRVLRRYFPPNAYGYVAPPAGFYLARPMPRYVAPVCDFERDWNC